jgi:ABC-type transporter Mla subunit MlaD
MKLLVTHRERAAGAFVLTAVTLVVLFVVGAAVRNRWFHPRVAFRVRVTVGDGLREGSPVFLSGVEVGEIGRLAILDDNRVDVELLIWEEHAHRIRTDTRAMARRLFGFGEKRIQLMSGSVPGTPLPAQSALPIDERLDLVDAVASVDLGLPMRVLDRTVNTADRLLARLDEGDRFERMMAAFDRLGPTLEKTEALLSDPNLHGTLQGLNAVSNSPATKKTLERTALLLAPERLDRLLARTESVLGRADELTAKNGALDSTLRQANRLMGDGRADRLLDTAVRLNDGDKLSRILDNTALLADQLARVGPAIPELTRELTLTLREAVVTLKALQQTWILESKAERARRELDSERKADERKK